METSPHNTTDHAGTSEDQPVNATVNDVEVTPAVTLTGIVEDLLIHAPERRGRPMWRYGIGLLTTTLLSSGFHMMFIWRFGAFFHKIGLRPLSFFIEKFIYHWYYCSIPCSVRIGPGLWVPHPLGIVFASRTRIGRNVWIRQHVQVVHVWEGDESGVIGDRAQINTAAILIRGAVIGHESIVGAAALVNSVIPPRNMAVGSPARAKPLRPEQIPSSIPRYR